jgi:hypothetical protein
LTQALDGKHSGNRSFWIKPSDLADWQLAFTQGLLKPRNFFRTDESERFLWQQMRQRWYGTRIQSKKESGLYQLLKSDSKFPKPIGNRFRKLERSVESLVAALTIASVSIGNDGWEVP